MADPTERLYYTDPYLRRFTARVVGSEGNRIYLDRTAFYPTSGGQPHDTGTIGGLLVERVEDEGERIAHVVSGAAPLGGVECEIDWKRRFDHMQQHSGQHLLSAVLAGLYNIPTVSFHLGSDVSTIDVATAALDSERVERAESRANEIVFENRPISINFANHTDDLGLRKASDREGELRIITIDDLDRSACGGTHVRSTAEIGPVVIRRLDKIRGTVRIEFLCGARALQRARADFQALQAAARVFSSSIDDVPALVSAAAQRNLELEKAYRRLAMEAAERQGRDLYAATEPDAAGMRRVVRTGRIDDELRSLAQAFVAGPKAVLLAVCEDPPSVLMAVSKDSGLHAGNLVKSAVTANGGRGGGSPVLGQGSVPGRDALEHVQAALR